MSSSLQPINKVQLFLEYELTLAACNFSIFFACFPIHTKVTSLVSRINTFPELKCSHDIEGIWITLGDRRPFTQNNRASNEFTTWCSPEATPPFSNLYKEKREREREKLRTRDRRFSRLAEIFRVEILTWCLFWNNLWTERTLYSALLDAVQALLLGTCPIRRICTRL